jgi:2-amino-4-hydroxy-6-hydroxymethyldihydropteridine diphosphokinase
MMNKAYLGLGSNLGRRLENLKKALRQLTSTEDIIIRAISAVYETRPVGGPEQGPYLNACVKLETALSPTKLLLAMQTVEDNLGRVRKERWGPRTIDLDLLIYENILINSPLLELPHPRIVERDFVLIPLAEIAPNLIIPGQTITVKDLLSSRPPTEDIVLYKQNPWFR